MPDAASSFALNSQQSDSISDSKLPIIHRKVCSAAAVHLPCQSLEGIVPKPSVQDCGHAKPWR